MQALQPLQACASGQEGKAPHPPLPCPEPPQGLLLDLWHNLPAQSPEASVPVVMESKAKVSSHRSPSR
eukprot:12408854-Karenia_brevis.AAC.1